MYIYICNVNKNQISMNKLFSILSIATMLVAVTSCSDEPGGPKTDSETEYLSSLDLNTSELQAVEGNNDFAWDFFAHNVRLSDTKNVAVSPLSMTIALTMTANATYEGSKARESILSTLGYGNLDFADVNSCTMKLVDGIGRLDKDVKLKLANSLWYDPTALTLNPAYVELLQKNFAAESNRICPETFVKDVNSWCNDKTDGMIDSFLPENMEPPVMALLNAIYFKGMWGKGYKFDKNMTVKDKFYNSDGMQSYASFMTQETILDYARNEAAEVVTLPFGSGKYNFHLVRPIVDGDIEGCMQSFLNGGWSSLKNLGYVKFDLRLPKFDVKYHIDDLKDLLAEMGMEYAMKNTDYYFAYAAGMEISKVIHEVHMQIDEEGAEAAGSSAVIMNPTVVPSAPFHLDHPFIYLLTEKESGAIIFIGCIRNL